MSSEKKESMSLGDFFNKINKLILLIIIIAAALLIGVFLSKAGGSIAGIFGILWGMLSGKGDKRKQRHDQEIKELDVKLDQLKKEEEQLTRELGQAQKDEEVIRQEISDIKQKYNQMSISDMIREHNESLGQ